MEPFEEDTTDAFIIVVENVEEKNYFEIKYYDESLKPQESVRILKNIIQRHFPMKKVVGADIKREQELLSQLIARKLSFPSGDAVYVCPKCPAEFRTRRAAKGHLNAHVGLRPFQCDQCSKAYTSDTALKAHLHNHSSREFICDYCTHSFKRKTTLMEHITTHSGKNYLCSQCGKVSHSKKALNRHIEVHKKAGQYKCTECTRIYSSVTSLNGHMEAKHGKKILTKKMFFNSLPMMKKDYIVSDLTFSNE